MFWNFKVGDRVRITQGLERYMYEPLPEGQTAGEEGAAERVPRIWKILECNKDKNTVILEGLKVRLRLLSTRSFRD